MTYVNPSLASSLPSPEPTLATVIAIVSGLRHLPAQRRHDYCSAIRSAARTLGRNAEDIAAAPPALRRRLKDFTPAMAGLTASRWRNVLSLLRSALIHAGLADMPGRHSNPLRPTWADLQRSLKNRHAKIGLSRLMSFASARGIDPAVVDDEFSAVYRDALLNDSLIGNPAAIHRRTCQLWNREAADNPKWPKQSLTMPVNRATYTLPWTSFPPSLHAEVLRYLDHLAGADILAERDFKPLAPVTLRSRAFSLLQYSSALVHRGRDAQTLRSLKDLVDPAVVRDGLRFFLDRPHGSMRQIHGIACVLKAVARHWVKIGQGQLDQLRKICKQVDPGPTGMTEKNKSRLRPFDDPAVVRLFLTLPQRLVSRIALKKTPPNYHDALIIQTALLFELLINIPMRVGNLTLLNLDRHLIRNRRNAPQIVHLAIPGLEVKNGVDIEAVLPPSVVGLLDLYLGSYRRLLMHESSPWLFPGRDNHVPKSIQSIRGQIQRCALIECGLRINPHLFRHIAAKVYLDRNPGAYGLVRLMLGHKSINTTTGAYCGMEGPAAFKSFDAHITDIRQPDARFKEPGCTPAAKIRSKAPRGSRS